MSKTIMLIHGAWLNSQSWEAWKAHYEAKGFTVVTPDWPFDNRSPAELRKNPDPRLAKIGSKAIIEHYAAAIRALPEAPMLIGHSLGGVYTQMLLDRGLGVSGVAIDPAPTPGVPLYPHAIASAFPVFSSLGSWGKVLNMSRKFFRTRFAQSVLPSEADELYDRYIVPTPGKVYWDGLLGNFGKPNWNSTIRPPLLLIGGGHDLIADGGMTKAIYKRQRRASSRTELKMFDYRTHWTCIEPGWEEVADWALNWSLAHSVKTEAKVTPFRAA